MLVKKKNFADKQFTKLVVYVPTTGGIQNNK
jgi:hypothetical protein